MHITMGDAAQHFESGRCPSCPGQDNAMRAAYGFAREQEQRAGATGAFTNGGPQMLTFNGAGAQDYTVGYQSGGYNYNCPGCGKQFRQLSALLNHQQAKPACAGAHHLARAIGAGPAPGHALDAPAKREETVVERACGDRIGVSSIGQHIRVVDLGDESR